MLCMQSDHLLPLVLDMLPQPGANDKDLSWPDPRHRQMFGPWVPWEQTARRSQDMRTNQQMPSFQRIGDRIVVTVDEIEEFLASDAGRRLRRIVATGVVVTVPLLFRIPGLRRYPLLRWLEVVGGAALLIKLAEALRDWEPDRPQPIVIDPMD